MKCPHCNKAIHFEADNDIAYRYTEGADKPKDAAITGFDVSVGLCPACSQLIVLLRQGRYKESDHGDWLADIRTSTIIYPAIAKRPVEPEVPERDKKDFLEAVGVLPISPKASAAIGRRLLQDILRNELNVKRESLSSEIDDFISRKDIPTYLVEAVDAVRNIGNFAAHPQKDQTTGEAVDVEPGEAEWLLEVLESIFDFAFVQPKRLNQRKGQLNRKLTALGKPPMKGT